MLRINIHLRGDVIYNVLILFASFADCDGNYCVCVCVCVWSGVCVCVCGCGNTVNDETLLSSVTYKSQMTCTLLSTARWPQLKFPFTCHET